MFFCYNFFFSKISFSLQKEEYFWKTNKNKKKTIKIKVAKLLTYGGQVIDPTGCEVDAPHEGPKTEIN